MKRKASPSKDITKSKKAPPTKKRKVFASPDLQKYALRARSSENKAVDTNFDLPFGNEDSLANKIVSINQCNKGTDRYQRIGRQVRVTGISVKGIVYVDGALPPNDHLHMMILYQETGPIVGSYTDIYQGTDFTGTSTGTTSYRTFNMRNLDNTEQYKVLWSKYVRITDTDELANMTETNNLEIEVHLPVSVTTKWDNVPTGSYDGSITSGRLYFIVQELPNL